MMNKKKLEKAIRIIIAIVLLFGTYSIISKQYASMRQVSVYDKQTFAIQSEDTVGKITLGKSVAQSFYATDEFQGLALMMANYGRTSHGFIQVEVKNLDSNEVVAKQIFTTGEIADNEYHDFVFDHSLEGGHRYEMIIKSTCDKLLNPISIWRSSTNQYDDGEAIINGQAQEGDLNFAIITSAEVKTQYGMFAHRAVIIILLALFLLLHVILDIRKMYEWIFKKRVWVALALLIFMVANKYNCSSIGQYDYVIQPGEGSEYVQSVFGTSRGIRGDEWNVTVPRFMSAGYGNYGKYNSIPRATTTTNISASGLYRGLSSFAQPSYWGFYLFGTEYGLSFMWSFNMIFGFLFSFDFCMILSKKKKILSLMGAALIWFSAYNMWWSTVNWVIAGEAAVVFSYYLLQEKNRIKRCAFAAGLAVAVSCYITNLYPAWLVTSGYVFLVIVIWMLIENWQTIRGYKWKDWLIVAGFILAIGSFVVAYLINYAEYISQIMNTVYPAARVEYGGFSLPKLMGYMANLFMSFIIYENPCKTGTFISLFPLPIILAILILIKKQKDLLLRLLLIPVTILTVYCIFPLPHVVAKVLLLTYSTPKRCVDIVGYTMILLLIVVLGRHYESIKIKTPVSFAITAGAVAAGLWYCLKTYPTVATVGQYTVVALVLILTFGFLFSRSKKQLRYGAMIVITIITIYTGINVNPLMCGTDAITSKPAATVIQEIVTEEPEAKWIATNTIYAGNFLIANGAPTINSTNYVPNVERWKKIDPDGAYEEVYNRYSHIEIDMVTEDTTMELVQQDYIKIHLSYDDLSKLEVSYICANAPLEGTDAVQFEKLYEESNVIIYKVIYQ